MIMFTNWWQIKLFRSCQTYGLCNAHISPKWTWDNTPTPPLNRSPPPPHRVTKIFNNWVTKSEILSEYYRYQKSRIRDECQARWQITLNFIPPPPHIPPSLIPSTHTSPSKVNIAHPAGFFLLSIFVGGEKVN